MCSVTNGHKKMHSGAGVSIWGCVPVTSVPVTEAEALCLCSIYINTRVPEQRVTALSDFAHVGQATSPSKAHFF